MLRYYWEAIFSVEYFPYWEFSILAVVFLHLRSLIRMEKLQKKVDEIQEIMSDLLNEIVE
tara:strand:+ start:4323 stop:4502 length:180 start_codon:yes stop_codon:yes gene_type:complete